VEVGVSRMGLAKSEVLRLGRVSGRNGSSEEGLRAYPDIGLVVMMLVDDVTITAVSWEASDGWLAMDVCPCLCGLTRQVRSISSKA
jgi:hypothetical protein